MAENAVIPVDDQSNLFDAHNRMVYRDAGHADYPAKVIWRNDTTDYILDVDNTAGFHANFGGKLAVSDGSVVAGVPLLFNADATHDIGATATTFRPRDLFLSRDATIGRNATVGQDLFLVGKIYVGDTSNAVMPTPGITINQGTGDDEILSLKSTDVAHGVTTITETDTYALFKKLTAASGGLLVRGINGGAVIGVQVSATGTGEDTAKSAGAKGTVYLNANKISGTGAAALGANGNLLTVASAGNTRFIVDAEGDIHADSGSGTANTGTGYLVYDEFEDADLIRALDVERAGPGLIKTEFDRMLRYGRADLEAANIATFNDHEGGDGSIFVNYSALTRLLSGAAWQAAVRIRQLEAELMEIKQRMLPA